MKCPHCNHELTAVEVATLHGQSQSAKRKTRSGGKVWKRHSIAAGSRCRCKRCNAKRSESQATRP